MKLNIPVFYYNVASHVLNDWNIQCMDEIPENLSAVINCEFKIAAISIMLNSGKPDFFPDPACVPKNAPEDMKKILDQIDLSIFDLVIITDNEYVSVHDIKQAVARHKIKNYVVALGGLIKNEVLDNSCMVYRPWWSYQVVTLNKFQNTQMLNKPYMFDALLGSRRRHRDFVMKEFIQSELLNQSIITYRNLYKEQDIEKYNQEHDQNFPEVKISYPYVNSNYSVDWEIPTDSNGTFPITGVPWEIYRQTYYTILTESRYKIEPCTNKDIFFMSEKTAKPILAKRLFIVFSISDFLKQLHDFGFKTFGNVIDESYDQEPDPFKRFSLAFEQVRYLHSQDPDQIYQKIQPIVEHNHQRLYELQKETRQQMYNLLLSRIPAKFID
jgi:hypothetical protein